MKPLIVMIAATLFSVSITVAEIRPVLDTVVAAGPQGSGCIDWTTRVILSRGIGAPNMEVPEAARRPGAIRAAQQVALRNALETMKGILLNSSTSVENFMLKSDVITSHITGFLRGFEQKGKEKYMSDGSVEVTMAIPLDGIGGFDDQLFGTSIADKPAASAWEGPKAKTATVFTGLIIDCKGLNIKPALSPRIVDESGKEVYGSAYVSREWAVKYGIAGYSLDIKDAAKLDRVGKTPGTIKAVKAAGDNSADVVISDADATELRSANQNLKFLSECRVVFIVD
jgi:hypothetical protein